MRGVGRPPTLLGSANRFDVGQHTARMRMQIDVGTECFAFGPSSGPLAVTGDFEPSNSDEDIGFRCAREL